MRIASGASLLFVSCCLLVSLLPAQDLRQQFGTRSAAAAAALQQGIGLVNAQKPAQAIPALSRAIEADPDLQLAHYWLALAHHDQGDIDEALAIYDTIVAIAERTKVNNVTVDACINAGLTLAQLKEEDKASQWFTKAIMYDPEDFHKLKWKAYRNMAIGQHLRERNLGAALCAANGYLADPRRVDIQMVMDFIERAERDEVARILNFGETPQKPEARAAATELSEAKVLPGISQEVGQILTDSSSDYVVAVVRGEPRYTLYDSQQQNAQQTVEAPGNIVAACFIAGRLYLSVQGTGLIEVELTTGKALREWKLDSGAPNSIAVLPAKGVALFPVKQVLTMLDLKTGRTQASNYYVDVVAVDPRQQYCYCFKRTEDREEVGHVIINGRPVLLHRTVRGALQTSLLKFAIADRQPILAELRMNAASNGRVLHVSPDGEWVAIAGGGGWRPADDGGQGAGYGVAVFSAKDLSHVQGFFATDAYPQSVALNSVTGQVAALRAGDGKIYGLAKGSEPVTIKGTFRHAAAWSNDGRYLYTAGEHGVQVFENQLTPEETTAAAEQRKRMVRLNLLTPETLGEPATASVEVEPLVEYRSFSLRNDRPGTVAAIELALAKGRVDAPREWLEFKPYQSSEELRGQFSELVNKLDRDGAGVRIYRLKKLKGEHPQHPGIDFLLGMSYYSAGQLENAETMLISAVQTDQGRTNISIEALRCLAEITRQTERPQAAAECFAHILRLDRNSSRLEEAGPFFERAMLSTEAAPLLRRSLNPVIATKVRLPALQVEAGKELLTAEKLFQSAAPSVVLIRTETSSGSGFCVAERGIIVTNSHVLGPERGAIRVTAFKLEEGKSERLEPQEAEVLYRSEEDDIAILRVLDAPESLVPLALEKNAVLTGTRVFSVGHPALGREILEQSITDGIISSASRAIGAKRYLQHTAAVNPGNSGGPLLNAHGHIVGIVTLKAELENVSFAIPNERLVAIFESLREE